MLALATLFAVQLAAPIMVHEGQGYRIVVEAKPCTSQRVIGMTSEAYKPRLLEATYVETKMRVSGCAILEGHDVFMLFEDNDLIGLPMTAFKPGEASAKQMGLRT